MTSAAQEILAQDEIDALIHGMGSGDIPTAAPPERDEARGYDFGKNTRIVRGRMPTLEMINERFGRLLRTSIYNLLRRRSHGQQAVQIADLICRIRLASSSQPITA
jgi:flagellar motor switch protein FliM